MSEHDIVDRLSVRGPKTRKDLVDRLSGISELSSQGVVDVELASPTNEGMGSVEVAVLTMAGMSCFSRGIHSCSVYLLYQDVEVSL